MSVLVGGARVAITPDFDRFVDEAKPQLKASLSSLDAKVPLSFDLDQASLAKARASMGMLPNSTIPVRFAADQASAAKVTAAAAAWSGGVSVPVRFNVDAASVARVTAATNALGASTAKAGSDAAKAAHSYGGWFGALKSIRNYKLPLYGGAFEGKLPEGLSDASGLHLLSEAIIETTALWAPATLAATAFGIAGMSAATAIATHMSQARTVVQATGQEIPPLTDHFAKLQAAVKPEVYQLFGDYLTIAGRQTGGFSTLATSAGSVLDQLGARFTVAVTQGSGFSSFMTKAAGDLSGLGTSIGNVGGIIGNVMKAVPGYAEDLLQVGVAGTHVAENLSAMAVPVLKTGLALHGAFFYGGLAVTGFAKLMPAAANGLSSLSLSAATAVSRLTFLGGAEEKVSNGLLNFGGAAEDAAALPWGWIGIAAAGIGVLTYELLSAKTATQQWGASMQTALSNAPITAAMPTILADLTAVNTAISKTQTALASTPKYFTAPEDRQGGFSGLGANRVREETGAYLALSQQQRQQLAIRGQLIDQSSLYNFRMAELGKAYGSQAAALGLLNLAGVTTKQMLDASPSQWAQLKVQAAATAGAYTAMGRATGVLGNDLQVIGDQATGQYAAIQKLNQAWQAQTANMTGAQTAADSYASAFAGLDADWKAAHGHIDALSASGLKLNSAFAQQVTSTSALYATWRTAGVASNLFTRGVKDSIAPLVQYARGSQEATDQLTGLAQQAGYTGPASMRSLTRWLGNTKGALQDVKAVTNQATAQEALLTSSMNAQGNLIASKLLGDISSAETAYSGVTRAATTYGKAVAQFGATSQPALTAQQKLTDQITAMGVRTGQTTQQIAAMITQVEKIPAKKAMLLAMDATGEYSITQLHARTLGGRGSLHVPNPIAGYATGAYVRAGTTPTADDVLARVSKGELIVPASIVAAGAVDHLRGQIPGFANGAYVGGPAGLGQFAVTSASNFTDTVATSLADALKSALSVAAQQAALPSSLAGFTAATGPAQSIAKAMLGVLGWSGQWPALDSLWNRESGWRWNARNPTSGAYGIPQALPASKMAAAGSDWLTNPATQIRWGLGYIGQRYGDPDGAWAHEVSHGWYDNGGWLQPGLTLAANQTGAPEAIFNQDQLAQLTSTGGADNSRYYSVNVTQADTGQIVAAFNALEMRAATQARIGRPQ